MLYVIWEWVLPKTPWLFSGVGVAALGVFFGRKKLAQRQTKIKNNIKIKSNKDTTVSFNGANFGVVATEVHNEKHKKDD